MAALLPGKSAVKIRRTSEFPFLVDARQREEFSFARALLSGLISTDIQEPSVCGQNNSFPLLTHSNFHVSFRLGAEFVSVK